MADEKPILIHADDDSSNRTAIKVAATMGLGMEYKGFPDGEPALVELRAMRDAGKQPGLIVSDGNMTKIHGDQFMREAREIFPNAPIILLTGNSRDFKAAADLANAEVLEKPVGLAEMRQGYERAKARVGGAAAVEAAPPAAVPGVGGAGGVGYVGQHPPQGHHRPTAGDLPTH